MDYIKEIKKEFPKIKPHQENDWEWENEAYDLLKTKKIKKAENLFKKLCLSQPEHHSGYEGLAYAYYLKNEKDKSLWFMAHALKKARNFLKDNSIDKEVIDAMEINYKKIKNNESISAWWNKN